jgi:hypothetical protein
LVSIHSAWGGGRGSGVKFWLRCRSFATHLVSTVTLLAVKLLLEAGVLRAEDVLAVAPRADTRRKAAVEAAATAAGRAAGSGTAPAASSLVTVATRVAAARAGRDVGALRDGSRSRGGETGRRRAVAVASGGRGGRSAVELLGSGARGLGGLASAEVRGNVSRTSAAVGLVAKGDASCGGVSYVTGWRGGKGRLSCDATVASRHRPLLTRPCFREYSQSFCSMSLTVAVIIWWGGLLWIPARCRG